MYSTASVSPAASRVRQTPAGQQKNRSEPPLRRRFEEKGALSDFVKEIPILMVLDAHPGLTGAMYCLAHRY